jgi:hypothetical protein
MKSDKTFDGRSRKQRDNLYDLSINNAININNDKNNPVLSYLWISIGKKTCKT